MRVAAQEKEQKKASSEAASLKHENRTLQDQLEVLGASAAVSFALVRPADASVSPLMLDSVGAAAPQAVRSRT